MASEAVIHFFGLVVATTQLVSPDAARVAIQVNQATTAQVAQVVMIMPDIAKLNNAGVTMNAPLQRASHTIVSTNTRHGQIEPHTAIIIFEARDLLSSRGWDINRLSDDFLSIELHGDVINFVANGDNPVPLLKKKQLPTIDGTLLPDYMPPAYSGAAAVFKIPYGKLTTCLSSASGTHGRVDNELHLLNSGTVSINSGAKSLTLNGDAAVYAGNAPMNYVTTHANSQTVGTGATSQVVVTFAPHYYAYCWMAGKGDENCTMPMLTNGCDKCIDNQQRQAGGPQVGVKPNPPVIFMLTSFECSNTQWP